MSDQSITRRKLLAVAGSVAIAGCGSTTSDPNEWGTKYATETERSARSSTATAPSGTRTTDSEGVEINVAESTETSVETDQSADDPGGTGGETETAAGTEETDAETTTEPADTVADHIQRARSLLSEAVTAYTGSEGSSLGSVDPASSFETGPVETKLASAREAVSGLSQSATGPQLETIDRIRAGAEVLELLTTCQRDVHEAYVSLTELDRAIFDEDLQLAADRQSDYSGNLSAARVSLASVREEADPTALAAIDPIDREEYEEKLAGFDRELAAMEDLVDPYERLQSALESYAAGVEAYTDAAYGQARTTLFSAQDDAERVYTTLSRYAAPGFLSDITDEATTAAEALSAGTLELQRSARNGTNGNEERREDNLRDALSRLRSDRRIQRLPSTRALRRETDA